MVPALPNDCDLATGVARKIKQPTIVNLPLRENNQLLSAITFMIGKFRESQTVQLLHYCPRGSAARSVRSRSDSSFSNARYRAQRGQCAKCRSNTTLGAPLNSRYFSISSRITRCSPVLITILAALMKTHAIPKSRRSQNVIPIRATTVLGCKKCVPLKVERKLYRATLFVRLAISTDAVYRMCPSE